MQLLKRASAAFQKGIRTLSPNCREASRLQSEAIDRPLSFPKRFGLGLHLLLCKWCRRYGKQLRFLRQAVHEHPEELSQAMPRTLSPEARERMRRALKDEAQ